MLFNINKPSKVQYFIVDAEHNSWDKALYQSIEPALKNLVGCPAISTVTNRIFNVKPPMSLDINFGYDGQTYINYNLDKKEFNDNQYVHNSIKKMVSMQYNNGIASLHYNMGVAFFTDDKDIELMLVGNDEDNCTFTSGAFNIHSWVRQLNAAWYINDNSKDANVSINFNEPIMKIIFNKSVELSEVPFDGPVKEYYNYMSHTNLYKRNVANFVDNIKRKRPKKLIV